MQQDMVTFRKEATEELQQILSYWLQHAVDPAGGFAGRIDEANQVDPKAPKGAVLNSRILWSFSAAYRLTGKQEYLAAATRALEYLLRHFIDPEFGGVYWTVDAEGKPLDTKKQVYALAFAIYGLSEYARCQPSEKAKEAAVALYHLILQHAHDAKRGGYFEAFTRDWKEPPDLRLSDKDANEKKSMNTHLHVLEAFSNLYTLWPDEGLKHNIRALIHIFLRYIVDSETGNLVLFFDEAWNRRSETVSFGHDIEASWLLLQAAETIGDGGLVEEVKAASLFIAHHAGRALDDDGGLWYELQFEGDRALLLREKHWWPQAEAVVGFYNAWQVSGDPAYLQQSLQTWSFIRHHMKDQKGGEWWWGIREDGSVMPGQDKVGIWKCPYHNSRACIEIINRITSDLNQHSI